MKTHQNIIQNSSFRRWVGIRNISDYSPFGILLKERTVEGVNFRTGFQGQEGDDEVSGKGNSYSAEFWQYSPRISKRWNIDPVVKEHESPYACFANNPIIFLDVNGADTTNFGATINSAGFQRAMNFVTKSATFNNTFQSFVSATGGTNSRFTLDFQSVNNLTDYKDGLTSLDGQALLYYDGVHVADITSWPETPNPSLFTFVIQLKSNISHDDGTAYQIEEQTAIKGITINHEIFVHTMSELSLVNAYLNKEISGDELVKRYTSDMDHENLYAGKCKLYSAAANEIVGSIPEHYPTFYKIAIANKEDMDNKTKRLGPLKGEFKNNLFMGRLDRKQMWRYLFDLNMTKKSKK